MRKRISQLPGEQRRQLVRSIREIYGGVVNSGEPLIFDALIEDVKKLIGQRHLWKLTRGLPSCG